MEKEERKNQESETKTNEQGLQTSKEKVTISKNEYEELTKRAKERDEFLTLIQKTKADFLNYQSRMSKEMEEARKFLIENFVKDLLPSLDNIENILKHSETEKGDNFVKGINLMMQEIFRVFGTYGVKSIESKAGELFDPLYHEVLDCVETNEYQKDTILEVMRKGYKLHGRVIRPASVKIAVPEKEKIKPEDKKNTAPEDPPKST